MVIQRNKDNCQQHSIIFALLIFSLVTKGIFSQDVEEPPVLKNYQTISGWINYPDSAKENKIEGKVTVKLLVGLQGEVEKIGELTGPEIFYKEIKRVSAMLKFKPAKLNGKKVKCWVVIPFNFEIGKEDDDE